MLFLRCGSFGCPQAQDALHLGRYGPVGHLDSEVVAALSVDMDSGMCMAGFAGLYAFLLCSLIWRQAHDAGHHGRCGVAQWLDGRFSRISTCRWYSDPVVDSRPVLRRMEKCSQLMLLVCVMRCLSGKLRWAIFKGPPHRCRAGGVMSTGTWLPRIRCIFCVGIVRDIVVSVTTTTTTTTLRSHFGSRCHLSKVARFIPW